MVRESEWREVRRRNSGPKKFQGNEEDPLISSFFVKELPGDASKAEIWKLCSTLGKVVNVYVAGRKDASGALFGFVRFANAVNPCQIEEELNRLVCRGRKIVANLSRHPRAAAATPPRAPANKPHRPLPSARKDVRSFAEVAKGKIYGASTKEGGDPQQKPIYLPCIRDIQQWLDNASLVGETKNFAILCNFPSLLSLDGFDVAEVKYIGGLQVVIQFKSDKAAGMFKANKSIWMKWFAWVDCFGKRSVRFERITWLKITGVPIVAWDESNFNSLASRFGKVLVNINPFWNYSDVSHGKVCILTASRKKLNEEMPVIIDGCSHKIGIFEIDDEWVPFKPFIDGSQEDSEEDDDGISDTFGNDEMDLEDGEIDPEGDGGPAPEQNEESNRPLQEDDKGSHGIFNVGARAEESRCSSSPMACNNEVGINGFVSSKEGPNNQSPIPLNNFMNFHSSGGPLRVGPNVSPVSLNNLSSPEFGPSEAFDKRRRLKQKKKSSKESQNQRDCRPELSSKNAPSNGGPSNPL
ncbi:hypothetical protein LXL04_017494 [Taraxacum kok-saghyz]